MNAVVSNMYHDVYCPKCSKLIGRVKLDVRQPEKPEILKTKTEQPVTKKVTIASLMMKQVKYYRCLKCGVFVGADCNSTITHIHYTCKKCKTNGWIEIPIAQDILSSVSDTVTAEDVKLENDTQLVSVAPI